MDTTTDDISTSGGGHEKTTLESGYESMSPASTTTTRSPRNTDMEDSPEIDSNQVVSGIEDKPFPNILPKNGKKFPVLAQLKKKIPQEVTPAPEKDDLSSEDEMPLSQRLSSKSANNKKKSLTNGKPNKVKAFRQKQSKFDREILSEMKNPKASTSGPLLREMERNRRRLIAKAKADAEGRVFIDSDFLGTPSPRQIQNTRSSYNNFRSSGLNSSITPRRKPVIKTSMSPEERRDLLKRKSPEKSIFARRSTYGNKKHLLEKREKIDTDDDDQEFQSLETVLKNPVATVKKGLKPNKENKPTTTDKKPRVVGGVATKIVSNQNQIVNGLGKQSTKINSNKIKKPEITNVEKEEKSSSTSNSTVLLAPDLSSADPKKSIEFINKTYPELSIEIIKKSDESLKNNESSSPSNNPVRIMDKMPHVVLERLNNLNIPKPTTDSLLVETRQKDATTDGESVPSQQQKTTTTAQKRRQTKNNNKKAKEEKCPPPAPANSVSTTTTEKVKINPSRIMVLKLTRLSEDEIKKMTKSSASSDRGTIKQINNKKKSVGPPDDDLVAPATQRLSARRKRNPKHGNDNFLFYN